MLARPQRLAVPCIAALALGLAGASGASERPVLRFTNASHRVVAGQVAAVAVAVRPAGVRCSLAVRYADGTAQPNLKSVRALQGRAKWSWRIAVTTPAGDARATVSCARAGRRSRIVTVVKAPIPASVDVTKQGFSQRNSKSGLSSTVSYGIMLANPSPDQDALDVTVLVNLIDADNRVLQTTTERVDGVAAASTFALGGNVTMPVITPVARLELVVEMGARAPRDLRFPTVANIRIVPSVTDKGYLKAVDGEIVNDRPSFVLTRSGLSAVLFDAAGNIVGGGSGVVSSALVPGARAFFTASSGLSAIPVDRGVVAQVSLEPSYRPMS